MPRHTPESKAALSARMKKQWADPAYRERVSSRAKEAWRDPEYRARTKAGWQAKLADPDFLRAAQERGRKAAAKRANYTLPPMTREQRLIYEKCRNCKVGREEALKAAGVQ